MKIILIALATCLTGLITQDDTQQPDSDQTKSIATFTENMKRHDGFVPFYWDEKKGQVFLEISNAGEEFLYVHSLATGLGSNPVGLDRGQLGDQKVVRFERIGPKVLLIQKNLRFRANTENELEQRAVEQSFAQSVIWGGKVEAESVGRFLVDATEFLLSDVHGVIGTLKSSDQGDFSLDKNRSAMFLPRCKSFPDNTELEATLTFSSNKPGRYVRQTTPTPGSVTLRQHHSFIRLPDDGYRPRVYDVRSPSISIAFADYASPLDQPLEQRWITRHRLIKKDPGADLSEATEPIVYYVDSGAPKQIQDALIEGASWWNEAFESAGFKNAFVVKLLPPDADPLDVRFNVIQWVHRSTRGWSYGGSVIDPRTGEIIKGHVSLGSLRVRQDQLMVNSLDQSTLGMPSNLSCSSCGIGGIIEEATLADLSGAQNALDVSLARIRQLSAHEVGHTLGFVHNFAASTYDDRASVMDYPAPRVKVTDEGKLDLSDAYGVGIGEWDKVSVQFAYSQFASPEAEKEMLDSLLDFAVAEKMIFLSDADARPSGASHPKANLWDNGTDPLIELKHVMRVRRIALDSFDPAKIPAETTSADIAQYLTPLYLHHRFQLQAAGKLVGGHEYRYGYAGSELAKNEFVPAEIQSAAVLALIDTIRPSELLLSEETIKSISPRPYSSIRDQEMLPSQTGRIFDGLAAARVAVNLTLDELLHPQRLSRLARQANSTPGQMSPTDLINTMFRELWIPGQSSERQIVRITKEAFIERLLKLADNSTTDVEVRKAAFGGLRILGEANPAPDDVDVQFHNLIRWRVNRFLERPYPVLSDPESLDVPPGSPIGTNDK